MLTGKHRRWLRAQAHHLSPVVQIGHDGLTESVVLQVVDALAAHELIKVKVSGDAREDEIAPTLAERTKSEVVQIIGHVVVLFRRRPKKPKVTLTKLETSSGPRGAPSKGHGPRPVPRARKTRTRSTPSTRTKKKALRGRSGRG